MNNTSPLPESNFHGTRPLITKREIDVLQLVASGRSSVEIGKLLFISEETVKTHRQNLLRKLNACNGASLVWKAFQHQVLQTS